MNKAPWILGFVGIGILAALSGRGASMLGRFFTWAELSASETATKTGLDNTIPQDKERALQLLVAQILDPLRAALGVPVHISSGFRSFEVNEAMHGSKGSQHTLGEAADIWVDGLSAEDLAMVIHQLGLPYDQVIWYAPNRGGHVHVSFTERRPNRTQGLHAPTAGGYVPWSPWRV